MSFVFLVILVKIAVTAVFVMIPFLVFPVERLNKVTNIPATGTTFYRLYGVAMLALLVGYVSAFPLIWLGSFPWAVVIMGIVSNAGVTLILLRAGSFSCKASFVLTYGGIAAGLVFCAAFPQLSLTPFF